MFRLALFGYIVKCWYVFIAWLAAGCAALFVAVAVATLMHYLFAGL
jgi:hypothetical protein